MSRRPDSKVVALDAYRPSSPAIDGPTRPEDVAALVRVAHGALAAMRDVLNRMRAVAVLGAQERLSIAGREAVRGHLSRLADELDRLAYDTELDGMVPLDGSFAAGLSLRLDGRTVSVALPAATARALGLTTEALGVAGDVQPALACIERAIEVVSTRHGELSVLLHRLGGATRAITDAQTASEVAQRSTEQIKRQASTALTAQAPAIKGTLVRFPTPPSP